MGLSRLVRCSHGHLRRCAHLFFCRFFTPTPLYSICRHHARHTGLFDSFFEKKLLCFFYLSPHRNHLGTSTASRVWIRAADLTVQLAWVSRPLSSRLAVHQSCPESVESPDSIKPKFASVRTQTQGVRSYICSCALFRGRITSGLGKDGGRMVFLFTIPKPKWVLTDELQCDKFHWHNEEWGCI